MSLRVLRRWIAHLAEQLQSGSFEGKLNAYLYEQSDETIARAMERVQYYHRTVRKFAGWHEEMEFWPKPSYRYGDDFRAYHRYFSPKSKIHYCGEPGTLPGDCPTLLQSRSIHAVNEKAILFKFGAKEFYPRIRDALRFRDKTSLAAKAMEGRACADQRTAQHDGIVRNVRSHQGAAWHRPEKPMDSRKQLLEFKYILFDQSVTSPGNPKWIMSSQSLCMMPQPACETWFMEGCLRPHYHFVPLKRDLSDLEEKIAYYDDHPCEAEEIIENANIYAARFDDAASERLIACLVLVKYLFFSGQINISERVKSFLYD
ncbi:glycosyl transferase family 90 [Brucella pseudogrignonensis]|jgi:hypothetical protein